IVTAVASHTKAQSSVGAPTRGVVPPLLTLMGKPLLALTHDRKLLETLMQVADPAGQLAGRLHAQFPDVVLIVAGGAEDQAGLAARLTDGSVHRFLHKPVSEQRVRLFVEAAWRRYGEVHSGPGATATALLARPVRRATGWWLAAGLAVLGAPLLWVGRNALPTHPRPAPAPAVRSAAPTARSEERR